MRTMMKKCQCCDSAFDTFDELVTHNKESHRSYFCDICYAGFISEPLLVEHRMNDHPEGCPAEISERAPTTRVVTPEITKIVDPEMDKAMEVVRTPNPDPFADKWHPALGQTCEQTYFCNVHKTERSTLGQMEGCQPLGGSTRCGHLTGRLANRLSGTRVYKSYGRPDLGVCVL